MQPACFVALSTMLSKCCTYTISFVEFGSYFAFKQAAKLKNSTQNAPNLTILSSKMKKNSGEGTQPYLQTPPHWEAGHLLPNLTLGADPGCIE